MQLIHNWRKAWRFWSVQLGLIGSAVVGVFILVPDAAVTMWAMLPAEFKKAIPAEYMPLIGVGLYVAGTVARVIKQKRLDDESPD